MNLNDFMWVIIAAVVLGLFQFLLGGKRSQQVRQVYAYLLRDARRRAQQPITVVVYLERRAETIMPLLTHLTSLQYEKLQVLVVVKQTAGSKAVAELQRYRRRQTMKSLRIIRYQRALTYERLISRYATGAYSMVMKPDERLNRKFFTAVSQIIAARKPDALIIRDVVRPGKNFMQAFYVLATITRGMGEQMGLRKPQATRLLISRKKIASDPSNLRVIAYLPDQWYSVRPTLAQGVRLSWASLVAALFTGGVIGTVSWAAFYYTDTMTAQVYTGLLIVACIVSYILGMLLLKGYRSIDYLNLILFMPLAPLYALLVMVARCLNILISPLRRRLLPVR
ncbi:MAG TPA: hypothetical protein VN081_00325 [Dongiaceae bacterium]|nr:hypothetical protein [Dongiaceae bacterium]